MRHTRRLPLSTCFALASLLALADGALSQNVVDTQERIDIVLASRAACGSVDDNHLKLIINASSSVDCDTTGEPDSGSWVTAACICDSGTLRAITDVDLSDYATLADLSDYATLSGTVRTTTNQTISGTKTFTGKLVANAGIQIQGNISPDPTDETANTLKLESGGGFTLKGSDNDVMRSTLLADGNYFQSLIRGNAFDSNLRQGQASLSFEVDEVVYFSSNSSATTSSVPLRIPAAASLPTCDTSIGSATSPGLMFDTTSGFELCACNGSAWAATDGSGTCS